MTLHVGAAVGSLPLEALARDVAARFEGGLRVAVLDLPDGVLGAFRRCSDGRGLIAVSTTAPDAGRTFLHELAHAIDSLGPGWAERSDVERERFAEALEEVLGEHRPEGLEVALELLVDRVRVSSRS